MSFLRPRIFLACLLGLFPAWLHASYTARKALEFLKQSVPREVSSQIVAIVGFEGTTEPQSWSFLVLNPSVPGQIQEYKVQDGSIRGPRTLASEEIPKNLSKPLPWGPLTVDSHDVARLIDDEVILNGVKFARIDYQLCWRDKGPEPLWMATLVGARGETLGHMFISSISGTVTHRAFYHDFPRPPAPTASGSTKGSQSQPGATGKPGGTSTRSPGTLSRKRSSAQETTQEHKSPKQRSSRDRPSLFNRR